MNDRERGEIFMTACGEWSFAAWYLVKPHADRTGLLRSGLDALWGYCERRTTANLEQVARVHGLLASEYPRQVEDLGPWHSCLVFAYDAVISAADLSLNLANIIDGQNAINVAAAVSEEIWHTYAGHGETSPLARAVQGWQERLRGELELLAAGQLGSTVPGIRVASLAKGVEMLGPFLSKVDVHETKGSTGDQDSLF